MSDEKKAIFNLLDELVDNTLSLSDEEVLAERIEDLEASHETAMEYVAELKVRNAELEAALERALADGAALREALAFIEFAPSFISVGGRTFWYAEGWVGGSRCEFSTGLSEGDALTLCQRLNTVIRTITSKALTDHPGAGMLAVMDAAQPLFGGVLAQYQAWINSPVYCHAAPPGNSYTDIPNSVMWRVGEALEALDGDENWLTRQLDSCAAEVATWSEYKRNAVRAALDDK